MEGMSVIEMVDAALSTGRPMPVKRSGVRRGEVYVGDPDPVVGHEQGGRRPVLVVSIHAMNRAAARLVISVPLTTTDRVSYAMPEMVGSMSVDRLGRRLGRVSPDTIEIAANRIGLLVGLGRSL